MLGPSLPPPSSVPLLLLQYHHFFLVFDCDSSNSTIARFKTSFFVKRRNRKLSKPLHVIVMIVRDLSMCFGLLELSQEVPCRAFIS
ncbi:hypothetical protein LWI28_026167 [Acer negundo]|uniref:Uncharacterized protein n=1 Tax=Acer negundo TaxID=4023 RepID=A0AAD5JNY3_ACENE|nr:hypothetical protein LWI28_026167 [Acer negundo]